MTGDARLIAVLLAMACMLAEPAMASHARRATPRPDLVVEMPQKVIYALPCRAADAAGGNRDTIVKDRFVLLNWGTPNPFRPGEWYFQHQILLRTRRGSTLSSSDVAGEDYLRWVQLAPRFTTDNAKVASIDADGDITIHGAGAVTFAVALRNHKPVTKRVQIVILPLPVELNIEDRPVLWLKDLVAAWGPPTTTKTITHRSPATVTVRQSTQDSYEVAYDSGSYSSDTFVTYAKYPGLRLAFDPVGTLEGAVYGGK